MNPGCAAEQAAWRELKDGWRPLYGDVDKIGVALANAQTDTTGAFKATFRAPRDFGGLHDIFAVVDGKQVQPKDLSWGEGTGDEMCLGAIYVSEP